MKSLFLGIMCLTLTACVSYPDVVQVKEGTELVSYQSVVDSPDHIGKQARWSGVIAEVINHKDNTQLDVLYYLSGANGRPQVSDEPVGRFRVFVDGFLDPVIYKQGKSITALGNVAKKQSAKIGEFEYEYPTIINSKVYLWKKQEPRAQVQFHYGWYGHPRYYWNGGARHIYIIGKDKPAPTHTSPKKDKRN